MVSEECVRALLTNFEEFKEAGSDKMQPRVLFRLHEEISESLAIIYFQSWILQQGPRGLEKS